MEAIARCESESSEPPEIRLTVWERILLHLLQQEGRADEYDAPREMTMQGMAEALGIARAHANVDTKKLLQRGLAIMQYRHVDGGKRVMTFTLTDEGYRFAIGLRDAVERLGCDVSEVISAPCPMKRVTPSELKAELEAIRERMDINLRRLDRLEANLAEVF